MLQKKEQAPPEVVQQARINYTVMIHLICWKKVLTYGTYI